MPAKREFKANYIVLNAINGVVVMGSRGGGGTVAWQTRRRCKDNEGNN